MQVDKYLEMHKKGASHNDLVSQLYQDSLSPMQAIKIIRALLSVALGDAKQIVMSKGLWSNPYTPEVVDQILTDIQQDENCEIMEKDGHISININLVDKLKVGNDES